MDYIRHTDKLSINRDNNISLWVEADKADSVNHYGPVRWQISVEPGQVLRTPLGDYRVVAAAEIQKLATESDRLRELCEMDHYDFAGIIAELDPTDIVNWAEVWDNTEIVQCLWDHVMDPHDIGGVITDDGLILMDGIGAYEAIFTSRWGAEDGDMDPEYIELVGGPPAPKIGNRPRHEPSPDWTCCGWCGTPSTKIEMTPEGGEYYHPRCLAQREKESRSV